MIQMVDLTLTILLISVAITAVAFLIGLIFSRLDNAINKRYITKEIHSNERTD